MASTSGEATDPTDADTISIQNLQLPFGILALDVWGKAKEQPGLVSVTVGLRDGFQSAAEHDALDASTIHYGELAKRIRGGCTARQPVGELIATVGQVVQDMADKDGRSIVASTAVALDLPKASMFGDGVTFRAATFYDEHGRQTADPHWAVTVRNVKIMTMIGVNSYERTAKQPIVATCTWHITSRAQAAAPALEKAVYRFEQTLVQTIQDTSFETLESLAHFTVQRLQSQLEDPVLADSKVQLRLEKPHAITFADAPAVEVVRRIPGGH